MKSLKTKTAVFSIVTIVTVLLFNSCNGHQLLSDPIDAKVFSMKMEASEFVTYRNKSIILFSFRKEKFGQRFFPEGQVLPAASTEEIGLRKNGDSLIKGISFRGLVLSKKDIADFITHLNQDPDKIDLVKDSLKYEIIFTRTPESDDVGKYVNYTIRARNKNTQKLSSASTRTNPCPPCRYAGQ
jgi:hypothetical protein